MTATRLIHCIFQGNLIHEPLLYNLGKDFDLIPNIRGATISESLGKVYLELEGATEEIERAIEYLRERGVEITDVPEGMPAQP